MTGVEFRRKFLLKGISVAAIISVFVVLFAYSIADSKYTQDVKTLEKRTTLQLNIEKERVTYWLNSIDNYGNEFVEAEPLRTFVVALADSESIKKNQKFLNEEKPYINTVLEGFVYQSSLKRASLIAGTGNVFLHSGYDGVLSKAQKQTVLEVIAESKLKYLPIRQEDGKLVLEIFKPIYGFVVDDLPVAVLHMAVELDEDFINLITKDLPVEETETITLWQKYDGKVETVTFNIEDENLVLNTIAEYQLGFTKNEETLEFFNTIQVGESPIYLTLAAQQANALKNYQAYIKNVRVIVLLTIFAMLVLVWGIFSKVVVNRYKKELEYKERLAKQAEKTVSALVKTLELRDPYLAGHYSNVKDMSLKIADEMKLSSDDISTLRYAALLAGIGKIAIPKNILTKPEKLTAEETKIMQSHVSFAEEILEDMEFDLPIKQVVSQMYERLDGSGYPRALSGVEISKLSRILAVCDVFCALKAPRSYREGKTEQQALEIMQKDIALFDAEVLSMLFKVINK